MAEPPFHYQASFELPAGGITVPAFHATAPAAAAEFGDRAAAVFNQMSHARSIAAKWNAEADYMIGLDGLKKQYATDPVGFRDAHDKLLNDMLSKVNDPEEQADLRRRIVTYGLAAANAVTRSTGAAIVTNGRTAADRVTDVSRRAAATAPPDARRVITRDHDGMVDDMARAGIISEVDASQRKFNFRMNVQSDDAARLTSADPDMAILTLQDGRIFPKVFPDIDTPRRFTLINDAYDAAAASERNNRPEAYEAAGLDAWRQGKLDQMWIDANRDKLTDAAAARLTMLATGIHSPAPAPTNGAPPPAAPPPRAMRLDPNRYADMVSFAAGDNGPAIIEAAEAYKNGAIDQDEFRRVYDMREAYGRDAAAGRQWAIEQRRYLLGMVRPTARQDPDGARQQMRALDEYEGWLTSQPDPKPEDGAVQVLALGRKYREAGAAYDRATLPIPRTMTAPRDQIDFGAIKDAAEKLNQLYATDQISRDDVVTQVDLLRSWSDMLDREAK